MSKTTGHPYLDIDSNGAILCTDDTITKAEIPEYVNGIKVTSIGEHAFENCESLMEITIPKGVTKIGDYAFAGCSSLTSVAIPDSVTSIGTSAFSYCQALAKITIPESVFIICENAFYCCDSLKEFYIDKEKGSLFLTYMDIPRTCKIYWRGEF